MKKIIVTNWKKKNICLQRLTCTFHREKEQQNRVTSVDMKLRRHKSFWSAVRASPGRAKMQPHLISFIQRCTGTRVGVAGWGWDGRSPRRPRHGVQTRRNLSADQDHDSIGGDRRVICAYRQARLGDDGVLTYPKRQSALVALFHVRQRALYCKQMRASVLRLSGWALECSPPPPPATSSSSVRQRNLYGWSGHCLLRESQGVSQSFAPTHPPLYFLCKLLFFPPPPRF